MRVVEDCLNHNTAYWALTHQKQELSSILFLFIFIFQFNYENWGVPNPDSTLQDRCVEVEIDGTWDDVSCLKPNNYICKIRQSM